MYRILLKPKNFQFTSTCGTLDCMPHAHHKVCYMNQAFAVITRLNGNLVSEF